MPSITEKKALAVTGCCALTANGQAVAEATIPLMKSRRHIAFPEAWDHAKLHRRLQQEFATGGMGSDRHFAWQQSSGPNVRFESEADISEYPTDVRFTPKSGHC